MERGWREGSEKEEGREEIKKDNIFLTSLLQKANNLASMLDGLEVYLSVSFLVFISSSFYVFYSFLYFIFDLSEVLSLCLFWVWCGSLPRITWGPLARMPTRPHRMRQQTTRVCFRCQIKS